MSTRIGNNRPTPQPAGPSGPSKSHEAHKAAPAPAPAKPAVAHDSFKAQQPSTNPFKGAKAEAHVASPGKALKSGKTDFNPQSALGLKKEAGAKLVEKLGGSLAKVVQTLAGSTKPKPAQPGPLA